MLKVKFLIVSVEMARFEYEMDNEVTVRRRGKTRLLFLIMILLVITTSVGAYFIGFYVRNNATKSTKDNTQKYHKTFQDSVDKKKLESNLR
jgi:flagellar basal body-associated protein FliL